MFVLSWFLFVSLSKCYFQSNNKSRNFYSFLTPDTIFTRLMSFRLASIAFCVFPNALSNADLMLQLTGQAFCSV